MHFCGAKAALESTQTLLLQKLIKIITPKCCENVLFDTTYLKRQYIYLLNYDN